MSRHADAGVDLRSRAVDRRRARRRAGRRAGRTSAEGLVDRHLGAEPQPRQRRADRAELGRQEPSPGRSTPAPTTSPIKNATLNPDGWVVHLEADAKDKAGAAVTYVIDGKIENLPMPNRSITGTWKSQRESGAFKISRQ